MAPGGSITTTFVDGGSNTFKTPGYESPSGYIFNAYIIDLDLNGDGRWVEEHNYVNIATCTSTDVLGFAWSHILSTMNQRTYDKWTLTVSPSKGSPQVKRVDVKFPSEFMWTDATCTLVSGVTQATGNYNPISCTSDCSSETCTNLISVTNFADTNVSDDIIIFIGAKSPLAAGATSPFEAYLYASETDTTAIIEKRTDLGSQTLAA